MSDLAGRWAVVTGAARRVGRAIALELGRRGANLVVHYRGSSREAEHLVERLAALGREARAVQADLADAAAVARLADDVLGREGVPAVLVNSASNYVRTPLEALDATAWDLALDVNLKAPYLLSIAFGRPMRERGDGCIVNIVDWAAERPYRDYLPYCVSKAGLVCLTKALARELAPRVRVNAVAPGPVLLPDDFTPREVEAVVRATPLGRVGTPEDVARCVAFLAADAAFTTGAVFHVDGGRAIA